MKCIHGFQSLSSAPRRCEGLRLLKHLRRICCPGKARGGASRALSMILVGKSFADVVSAPLRGGSWNCFRRDAVGRAKRRPPSRGAARGAFTRWRAEVARSAKGGASGDAEPCGGREARRHGARTLSSASGGVPVAGLGRRLDGSPALILREIERRVAERRRLARRRTPAPGRRISTGCSGFCVAKRAPQNRMLFCRIAKLTILTPPLRSPRGRARFLQARARPMSASDARAAHRPRRQP